VTDTKPARLPREKRREQLLDVAATLILEKGLDAVTMERVAYEAGVSKGLGYAYFENSDDLLQCLLAREIRAHGERVSEAMAAVTTLEDRIRASIRVWFDTVSERGALLAALLQANRVGGALDERRSRYNRRIEEFWGDLVVKELGVPREKAVAASAILIAGLSGVLGRWVKARDSRQLLEDTYVELAIHGLRGMTETADAADTG